MGKQQADYTVKPFPLARQIVIDAARLGRRKHMIHGLLEMDVTEARRLIREHEARTGEKLSFTAFIVACLGRAVDANKHMHALRDWRNRLILFDEVDVSTIVEVDAGAQSFPLAHVIRAANKRSVSDIHAEIRRVQANPEHRQALRQPGPLGALLLLPAFVRDILYGLFLSRPHLVKRHIGTVALTAVGMYGEGGGWGIALSLYNLNVVLGGIAQKPGVVDGQIAIREVLSVTVSVNHDIVDGAPAARFSQRFKALIEAGHGLADGDPEV